MRSVNPGQLASIQGAASPEPLATKSLIARYNLPNTATRSPGDDQHVRSVVKASS